MNSVKKSVHENFNSSSLNQPFFQLMCYFAPLTTSNRVTTINCYWAICGVAVTGSSPQMKAAPLWCVLSWKVFQEWPNRMEPFFFFVKEYTICYQSIIKSYNNFIYEK